VLVQAVEEPVGDREGVVVGAAGQGQAADQDIEADRGGGVVAVVGQVGFVDDAADLFQRRVGGQVERGRRGFERAVAVVVPERALSCVIASRSSALIMNIFYQDYSRLSRSATQAVAQPVCLAVAAG
jgi:threonine dehydrogenase-like Zn-dependent dehydrogenase